MAPAIYMKDYIEKAPLKDAMAGNATGIIAGNRMAVSIPPIAQARLDPRPIGVEPGRPP